MMTIKVGGIKKIGKNTIISEAALIDIEGDFIVGDNSYIGPGVKIICHSFKMGDYGKIHDNCLIYGYKHCKLGHNLWVGGNTIIDTIGGVDIGDNCGIGAYSQMWTHMRYGDTLEGCKWNSSAPLVVEKDVWFVGHCIVSPIVAKSRSMAMVGSVVTKNMEHNRTYGGVPATDVTDKVGSQFGDVTVEQKVSKMIDYLQESGANKDVIRIITDNNDIRDDRISYFNVTDRTYTKRLSNEEIKFINYLLPVRAKFTPLEGQK
jgi:acetyltransferase-like isoleucine patch superfamily enzyme